MTWYKLETVAIAGENNSRIIINKSDFDPDKHVLWEDFLLKCKADEYVVKDETVQNEKFTETFSELVIDEQINSEESIQQVVPLKRRGRPKKDE